MADSIPKVTISELSLRYPTRKIEVAADDHEGHAKRHDPQDGRVPHNAEQIVHGQELRVGDGKDDHEDRESDQDALFCQNSPDLLFCQCGHELLPKIVGIRSISVRPGSFPRRSSRSDRSCSRCPWTQEMLSSR